MRTKGRSRRDSACCVLRIQLHLRNQSQSGNTLPLNICPSTVSALLPSSCAATSPAPPVLKAYPQEMRTYRRRTSQSHHKSTEVNRSQQNCNKTKLSKTCNHLYIFVFFCSLLSSLTTKDMPTKSRVTCGIMLIYKATSCLIAVCPFRYVNSFSFSRISPPFPAVSC